MIPEQFIIVGAIISFLGGISYLIDTIRGTVKPNKISWFIWAVAPLIAFFAEIKQGVGLHALLTFIVGFNPLLIFLGSFINKKAYWQISKTDMYCGALSAGGLVLWYITKEPNIAILFSILADGLAGIPTVVKAYVAPETENYHAFLASAIASGLTLLTITEWTFAHYGFPLYIFLICITLFTLIRFPAFLRSKDAH